MTSRRRYRPAPPAPCWSRRIALALVGTGIAAVIASTIAELLK